LVFGIWYLVLGIGMLKYPLPSSITGFIVYFFCLFIDFYTNDGGGGGEYKQYTRHELSLEANQLNKEQY